MQNYFHCVDVQKTLVVKYLHWCLGEMRSTKAKTHRLKGELQEAAEQSSLLSKHKECDKPDLNK